MEKRLIFIRHAKAEDQASGMSDFERSLTGKGKQQSGQVARVMRSKEKDPGLIVSSPAFRALETALIFGREYGISHDTIVIRSALYSGLDPSRYIAFITSLECDTSAITFFGHNSLITDMACWFAADAPDNLPKAGVFCLSFNIDSWSGLEPRSGKTEYFLSPKTGL